MKSIREYITEQKTFYRYNTVSDLAMSSSVNWDKILTIANAVRDEIKDKFFDYILENDIEIANDKIVNIFYNVKKTARLLDKAIEENKLKLHFQ